MPLVCTQGLRASALVVEGAAMADDLADAAGLLWEQAKAALTEQKADVDAVRTRAVALLSVASLVAGLFGSRLPHGNAAPRTVSASIAALVLFGISVVLALLIVAPKRKWEFTFELDRMIELVDRRVAKPEYVTRNLAAWAEIAWERNQHKLDDMYVWFGRMCLLVGLQVVAWAIAAL